MRGYKNLLFNTSFKNLEKSWVANNGTLKRQGDTLMIRSDKKLFGVTQDFFLFKNSRLYFGLKVMLAKPVEKILVGISCDGELHAREYDNLSINRWQTLSVIADIDGDKLMQKSYSVYIVVRTRYNVSEIKIKEPVLFDLGSTSDYYALKANIDKVPYVAGITYTNERTKFVFSKWSFAVSAWGVEKRAVEEILWDGNRGLTFTVPRECCVSQQLDLVSGHKYLVKFLYERTNNEGVGKLIVNGKATKFDEYRGQCYHIFKAKDNNTIQFQLENSNDVVPMVCYIQNMLMVDLTKQELTDISKESILRMPYVERW